MTQEETLKAIQNEFGYDGIVAKYDRKVLVAYNPEQIKSADPVTYDDNGNVIPLSERFNPEQKDIRYSRKPNLIDNINELAGEESDAELTKSQKVAKVRGDLERMNVGSGEIMQLQSVADKLFDVYGGESSISEFIYGMLEATKLGIERIIIKYIQILLTNSCSCVIIS